MNATPTIEQVRNTPVDTTPDRRPTPERRRRSGLVKGGVLVTSLVTAGCLFWGVPALTPGDDLPDPEAMALLGDGRNTSAENVAFWTARAAAVPMSAEIRAQLASAQLTLAGDTGDLGGYERAEQTAITAVELDPDSEPARLALAAALAGQHDFTGALAIAEGVLDDDPQSVAALLAAGDAHLELGDYGAARSNYDDASALVGGKAAVLSRYARLESTVGSLDEAADLARRALVEAGTIDLRHTDAAFYWFQVATFDFHRGRHADAEMHVAAALSIDPDHGGATELLGRILVARGDDVRAIGLYEEMVDGGGAADLHGELSKLYRLVGRDSDADEQRELGLAVAARDADRFPAERRHLIGFLADHDPDEALRLAELDLADRQDVHAHAWYAWSLFRNGRVEAAARAIEPALVHRTEDAWLLYQAGAIKVAAGDVAAGRGLLEAALDLNPGFDLVHADRAREILAAT